MYRQSDLEMRVLVLAPIGRDAILLSQTLEAVKLASEVCSSSAGLWKSSAEEPLPHW